MLTDLLDQCLPVDAASDLKRDVLHHGDPAQALPDLSAEASVLVIGSSSHSPGPHDTLGITTRNLLGCTGCPMIMVPRRTFVTAGLAW